mgnify:CR=1 FL=1
MRREIIETIKLSIPIIIAQLGVILMGVTDNLMVGRFLGAVPLGAAGLATSLSFLVTSIGFGGLGVVSSLISQARGQHNSEEIARLFKAGLWTAGVFSGFLGLIGVLVGVDADDNVDLVREHAHCVPPCRDGRVGSGPGRRWAGL